MMMANSQESMKAIHLIYPPDDDDVDVDEFDAGSCMLLRLSIKSCNDADADADADTNSTEEEKRGTKVSKIKKGLAASLPGTPDRLARRVGWDKEYASESEGRSGGRRRKGWRMRDRWVEKEWERRRRRSGEGGAEGGACRLVVRPMGPDSTCICMDMMEVKACRDLGLDIPRDWTVEMPGAARRSTAAAAATRLLPTGRSLVPATIPMKSRRGSRFGLRRWRSPQHLNSAASFKF